MWLNQSLELKVLGCFSWCFNSNKESMHQWDFPPLQAAMLLCSWLRRVLLQQADVYLPFGQLAEHIQKSDESPSEGREGIKAYLAQKDVKDVFPSISLGLVPLPRVSFVPKMYTSNFSWEWSLTLLYFGLLMKGLPWWSDKCRQSFLKVMQMPWQSLKLHEVNGQLKASFA